MALLFLLVLIVKLVEDLHLFNDALVNAVKIVLIQCRWLCDLFGRH